MFFGFRVKLMVMWIFFFEGCFIDLKELRDVFLFLIYVMVLGIKVGWI